MDNIITENYDKLCRVWLNQVKLSNPEEIIVLYNKNPPEFLKDHLEVKLIKCDYGTDFENPVTGDVALDDYIHFMLSFKMYNLFKLTPPFIYLDVDAIPIVDINELWSYKNNKPFIGIGHQNYYCLEDLFNEYKVSKDPKNILNGGVFIINDLSFIDTLKLKQLYDELIINDDDIKYVYDDILLTFYFNKINYDFKHPKLNTSWNCAPRTIFKIREFNGKTEVFSRDDDFKFELIKILHYYGVDKKPWITPCKYYNYLLKKYNL